MLWYIYYSQRLWVISFIAWNVFTIRLRYFPQVTTFDLRLLINSEQITLGHAWLQNSSTRFIKSCGLVVWTSNITKLRICCCGFKNSSDGHSGATSAATFSVAVAATPLLFFVTSDKRQRRCLFNQKSGSALALFVKQIFCRCRYSYLNSLQYFFDSPFHTLPLGVLTLR